MININCKIRLQYKNQYDNKERIMIKKIKGLIAVLLVLSVIASFSIPVFGVEITDKGSKYPLIIISGDGTPIVDENENEVFVFKNMFNNGTFKKDELFQSIFDIIKIYILEGRLTGNYDNYYQAIFDTISEIFAEVRLDDNGEVTNGTNIPGWHLWKNWCSMNDNLMSGPDYFAPNDYQFWYDWRKDPIEIADELNEYIEAVKYQTGCSQVCINSRCLGTNIFFAYMSKYGLDSIHGVSFDGSTVLGTEALSEPVSGKFNLDGDAIIRFLYDSNAMDLLHVDQFIIDTVDLLEESGTIQFVEDYTKLTVYDKVKYGVTSALSLSTFFTWPGYWASVASEDFENAKYYVFGEEGSAKREQYAGLIEKIDNYDRQVRQNLPRMLEQLKESDTLVAVFSKYGAQLAPICESNDLPADQIATVRKSSFGATTSTLYEPFSDEYVAQREAEGKGKYISPDRLIDASTCMFPDQTWFLKGERHSEWSEFENNFVYTIITADTQYYIDDFEYTQFLVFDQETKEFSAMTEENCHNENWEADWKKDKSRNPFIRTAEFFKSLIRWYKSLIKFIRENKEKEKETPEYTVRA